MFTLHYIITVSLKHFNSMMSNSQTESIWQLGNGPLPPAIRHSRDPPLSTAVELWTTGSTFRTLSALEVLLGWNIAPKAPVAGVQESDEDPGDGGGQDPTAIEFLTNQLTVSWLVSPLQVSLLVVSPSLTSKYWFKHGDRDTASVENKLHNDDS